MSLWIMRRDFVDDDGHTTARWWLGSRSDDGMAFGEPEDAEYFGRRIDAEEACRRRFDRVDSMSTAQRLSEALAEVQGVAARLSGTAGDGTTGVESTAPVAAFAGGSAP